MAERTRRAERDLLLLSRPVPRGRTLGEAASWLLRAPRLRAGAQFQTLGTIVGADGTWVSVRVQRADVVSAGRSQSAGPAHGSVTFWVRASGL